MRVKWAANHLTPNLSLSCPPSEAITAEIEPVIHEISVQVA